MHGETIKIKVVQDFTGKGISAYVCKEQRIQEKNCSVQTWLFSKGDTVASCLVSNLFYCFCKMAGLVQFHFTVNSTNKRRSYQFKRFLKYCTF